MSKTALSLALLATLAAAPLALHADTYSLKISTPTSTFVANGTGNGSVDPFNSYALDITSITGSADGYKFLSVVDPGITNSHKTKTDMGFTFDNVLYFTGGPVVDSYGVLLDLASPAGTSLAHVFYTGNRPRGYEVDVVDPHDPGAFTPFSISFNDFTVAAASIPVSPAPVPEPTSLALLGTGLAGLTTLIRRRSRS